MPSDKQLIATYPPGRVASAEVGQLRLRLPHVRLAMLHHVVLPDETLAAGVAGVGLLAGVQAHVPPEVRLVVELLGAEVALVRLIARVLGEVLLVGHLAGEALAAPRALERLVAAVEGLVVLREVARLVEHLVAVVAFVEARLGQNRRRYQRTACVLLVITFDMCLLWGLGLGVQSQFDVLHDVDLRLGDVEFGLVLRAAQ